MKHFILITLLSGLLLAGCQQTEKQTASATDPAPTLARVSDNAEELQRLVRQLYEWHETKSSQNDFEPLADNQDSSYVGIDLTQHKARVAELQKTGFFSSQFLDNYNRIGLTIDKGLKTKKLEWLVGDLPPFGNDANPWCNCQDNPDTYWQTLTLNKITADATTASFAWTWGGDFAYEVKAIRDNGKWKITYLQGFDFNAFFPTN